MIKCMACFLAGGLFSLLFWGVIMLLILTSGMI